MNAQRPYVICHMMQTLDGKIASGVPDKEILMDFFDLYTKIECEFESKAWAFGRKTASAFAVSVDTPLTASKREIDAQDFIAGYSGDTFSVIVDTKGSLRWKENFINLSNQEGQFHLIVLVTQQTPKEYLAYLQDKDISYLFGGEKEIDFKEALKKLKEVFGIEKILLEGGGSFNGSMMSADVVDEISLLFIPRILNKKDAPSLFDSETKAIAPKDYQLVATKELERGVLWLRYKKNY